VHWLSLSAGLAIMLGGTLYPPLLANPAGRADPVLALLVFWAMSAGFVRGVGFVPHHAVWRWLFSGWACAAALCAAAGAKFLQ
jgi:predicted membrane protein